jgi:hypothetical protein
LFRERRRVRGDRPRQKDGSVAMPITDVRMQNFRSFSDETTLQFKRGLNVLVSTLLPTPLARALSE